MNDIVNVFSYLILMFRLLNVITNLQRFIFFMRITLINKYGVEKDVRYESGRKLLMLIRWSDACC